MKRVLTGVVLIPIVLALVIHAPFWLLMGIVAVVAVIAAREYLDLAQTHGIQPLRKLTLAIGLLPIAALAAITTNSNWFAPLVIAASLLLYSAPFVLLSAAMRRQQLATALPAAAVSFFGLFYVVVPLAAAATIRILPAGIFLLIYLLVIVWSGDIAAYYAGRMLGRHKLASRISPNKTWEGAVGSVVGSLGAAYLLAHFAGEIGAFLQHVRAQGLGRGLATPPLWVTLVLGVSINLAAQLGDLTESTIKRGAGVKDSGSILPGHGGMLDRIDALLFAAPVAVILFAFTYSYFLLPS